ncbi:MAG: hypothetical protein EBT69_09880 [Verrucomicrobia bacterium]|nr:hypothetical protein [Verrucomicrobiota bacterium]
MHRWGVSVISVIGDSGEEGEAWMDHANKEGVRVLRIPVMTGMRQGWALLEEGVERIDFFTDDLKVPTSNWGKIKDFWIRNLKPGDWWVVAGSSATGWPKGWWKKMIRDLQKRGVSVLVDSRGALMREAVEAGVEWIKCNLAEAEATTGLKGVDRCVRSLKGDGTTGVVVTLGKDGLVAEVNGTPFFVPAPQMRVRDATGSGDVLTAALIFGELHGWTTDRTLRSATLAAAWNAVREATAEVPRTCLRD